MEALIDVIASTPTCSQSITVSWQVIEILSKHRQMKWWAKECGGQLFGSVRDTEVDVSIASGPYRNDYRSRFGYRSNPLSAQAAIDQHASRGLQYLGEWHTHPEQYPKASLEDKTTIACLLQKSALRLPIVIMMIQGTEPGIHGLALYTYGGAELIKWDIRQTPTGK